MKCFGGGLERDDGGLLPDAYLHLVRKKRSLISDHIKGPLVTASRSPLMKEPSGYQKKKLISRPAVRTETPNKMSIKNEFMFVVRILQKAGCVYRPLQH